MIGGALGAVGSTIAQARANGGSLSGISWHDVGASAVGGAVSGGLAGLTLGTSLVVQGGAGAVIAVGAVTNVAGGAVTRALDSRSDTQAGNLGEVAKDAAWGAAGGAVAAKVEKVAKAALPPIEQQAQDSVSAARSGTFGASQSVSGHSAKAARVRSNADISAMVAASQTKNVKAPMTATPR